MWWCSLFQPASYIVRATDGEERADAVVDVLVESGIRRVGTEET